MAARKEYEMLFSLNAQLGGSFGGTFSKAQQQMLQMQKEVQNLNKTQSDISAYQRQQQAVEGTKSKLALLQQQYDNIQKEIQETGTYSSDLENKLLAKQHQIDKTTDALGRQTQKLDEMGNGLREAGVDTGNLEKESERLASELGELKKKQEGVAEGAQDLGSKGADAFSAIGAAIAAAGIGKALKEIYDGIMECVSVAGDFEASISNVEAISGASAEEIAQLSDLAKQLGATTKFTAKESADAMGYMAMAGWSAEQMLSGMPGVLTLAAASGEDLAQVSDIVTDSMTAFGLSASETARYADVLAATAANANTSVGVMGETFKYAAPVAGALGYSIEDVSVAIGLMANAGIKGSNAGTALRNVFNGLLEGVTLTGKAFGEAEVTAVKADGTMEDFGKTLDELRGYFEQMTDAERVNNAMAIAGQRGYAGLLAVLNASEEDFNKLTTAINNSTGAAQKMADVKMNNMVGQLTLLNSAWEAVKTTVGEQFTPILSKLYGWGAEILAGINKFLQANPGLIKGIAAFAAVIGLVVGALAAYTAAAKVAAIASAALSAAIPGLNIVMAVTAGIGALVGAVVALSGSADDAVPSVQELTQAAEAMQDAFADSEKAYTETRAEVEATAGLSEKYIARLRELEAQGLSTKESQQEYAMTVDMLNQLMPELNATIDEQTHLVSGGVDALSKYAESWKEAAVQEALYRKYQDEMAAYGDAVVEVATNEEKLRQARAEGAILLDKRAAKEKEYGDKFEALQRQQQDALSNTSLTFEEQQTEWQRLQTEIELTQNEYMDVLDDFDDKIANNADTQDHLVEAIEKGKGAADEYLEEVTNAENAIRSYNEEVRNIPEDAVEVTNAIDGTVAKIQELTEAYNEAYEAAYKSISGQYDLWDEAEKVVATSVGSINSNLESQTQYWNAYNDNLVSLQGRTGEIEGLSEVIASFADGSKESVNAIAGMAAASDEELKTMVKNYQENKKAMDTASQNLAGLVTDFENQYKTLIDTTAGQIAEMDFSDEAVTSAKATIQSYINAASDELPAVIAAYEYLGAQAAGALAAGSKPKKTTANAGDFHQFASGTDNAPSGMALVGEEGPELVLLKGGEQILTAAETKRLREELAMLQKTTDRAGVLQLPSYGGGTKYAQPGLARVGEYGTECLIYDAPTAPTEAQPISAGGYNITFSPIYNINGDMNAEELEVVLRRHDENLKEQLSELLEELESDKARSRYA